MAKKNYIVQFAVFKLWNGDQLIWLYKIIGISVGFFNNSFQQVVC